MSEEPIQDKPHATVCGVQLLLRPFTNAEADEWARIFDERDLENVAKRAMQLQADIKSLTNKRVELQAKGVETLEERLQREYEKDEWDFQKIDRLTDRIIEENEKLTAMQADDWSRRSDELMALADRLDETAQVTDEANLEMCHYLAGDGRKLEEWLASATSEDYKVAGEVVKAGNTPFLNRRQRRARKAGKGTR